MITNDYNIKTEPLPVLIKLRDVSKLLSVSLQTVHNLIDSGALDASEINPAMKERKHLRVTRNSLVKFYKKRFGHSLIRALANPFEP